MFARLESKTPYWRPVGMQAVGNGWIPLSSGWERLVFTTKRLGTVGFHFQAVGNGWFPLSSGWERLVFTSKRLGTVSFHFQAVGSLMQRLVIRPPPRRRLRVFKRRFREDLSDARTQATPQPTADGSNFIVLKVLRPYHPRMLENESIENWWFE